MNISFLRRTYKEFLEFITKHIDTPMMGIPEKTDQAAYLHFYRNDVVYLSESFNYKPYWKEKAENCIDHFHGMKPHDNLRALMGNQCDVAIKFLCNNVAYCPHTSKNCTESSFESESDLL